MDTFVALVGFMGTGKTTIGRRLADALGWTFVDTDKWIEQRAGKTVSSIFAEDGEAVFRDYERDALQTHAQPKTVIATGGGMILAPENRQLLARGIPIVLDASLEVVKARVRNSPSRPLSGRLQELYDQRASLYAAFPYHVDAARPVEIVLEEILRMLRAPETRVAVQASRSYSIQIENGLLNHLGEFLKEYSHRALVVTDSNVWPLFGETVRGSLLSAGITPLVEVIPAGEASKSWDIANHLFTRMIEARMERSTPVIALGGGVVGDLAGFVASTYQRGVPFIQVPTTLLAQVDSSVGGKVAINHPLAKNMIGSFYQPHAVFIDSLLLRTLPEREWRCGLAELIKYGVILDEQLFLTIEEHLGAILRRDSEMSIPLITRACELKAQVVAQDERDEGLRAILNFGHTIGHAIEATAGFGIYTHGEAVAIGMVQASRLSQRLGRMPVAEVRRLISLLQAVGLPTELPELPVDALIEAMRSDKKNQAAAIRFVLPTTIGKVGLSEPVAEPLLRQILES